MTLAREWHLASRPDGWPTPENFTLAEVSLSPPGPGQLLVRNTVLSVDPYMRGRMNDVRSYVPPFQVGAALDGGAIGEVVTAEADGFKPGDLVLHGLGWRDNAIVEASSARRVDTTVAPASAYLGVLGLTGLTAYAGLVDIATMGAGETVFVSGAAGAVGSIAGQIARLRGAARVVGSAGSSAKVERVLALGSDAAFDYHVGPVRDLLRVAAPDGIDVYFDNVGGDHLEAAIGALRPRGRVAMCGAIAAYNATSAPPGPSNLALAIGKRLTLRGFIATDHGHLRDDFEREVGGWLRSGELRHDEHFVDGLDHAPDAFLGLLRGDNTGKMLVRL